jgi:hypothetical protein
MGRRSHYHKVPRYVFNSVRWDTRPCADYEERAFGIRRTKKVAKRSSCDADRGIQGGSDGNLVGLLVVGMMDTYASKNWWQSTQNGRDKQIGRIRNPHI